MTLILTLQLDPASQAHFNHLRARHYPPERNLIDAHVTLFHTLPDEPAIVAEVAKAAGQPAFPVAVTGLRSLGRGAAYTLESAPLQALHRHLATAFAAHLSAQDRQPFRPHIVVQNKVAPADARLLLAQLQAEFTPRQIDATGLALWHYRNGPWEPAQTFTFSRRLTSKSFLTLYS